ncbi:MAG: holo-ACP synthase [Anaplasmataceae bacterium]|nr:holo-ACP synthase [Anaplasmataceae bacterium]
MKIGVDIVEKSRIASIIDKFQEKTLRRIFAENELKRGKEIKNNKLRYGFFAKRFAAKEALIKAHGKKLLFKDIEVNNNEYGKPLLYYKKTHIKQAELSLSDDGDYAIAMLILLTEL